MRVHLRKFVIPGEKLLQHRKKTNTRTPLASNTRLDLPFSMVRENPPIKCAACITHSCGFRSGGLKSTKLNGGGEAFLGLQGRKESSARFLRNENVMMSFWEANLLYTWTCLATWLVFFTTRTKGLYKFLTPPPIQRYANKLGNQTTNPLFPIHQMERIGAKFARALGYLCYLTCDR